VRLFGPNGQREIPLADFYVAPKSSSERENILKPNEILTEIVLLASSRGVRNATYEVRQKEALDWPLATASVALRFSGGKVVNARIVLGHVAPVPWPAKEADKWIEGKSITEQTAAQAGEAAVRGARPLSRNKYKVQLARVAVKRAILEAARSLP
jgi:xanthine dehydrogenase YagS FAD-binding subunit